MEFRNISSIEKNELMQELDQIQQKVNPSFTSRFLTLGIGALVTGIVGAMALNKYRK